MVKGGFTVITALAVLCAAFLLFNPVDIAPSRDAPVISNVEMIAEAGPVETIGEAGAIAPPTITVPAAANAMNAPPGMPPRVDDVLRSGVLIVISKGSQQMFVFRNGALWDTSPVSTGRPGHDTPVGIFPILQKRVRHFSNLYRNAPMPHMQRLTWGGIALHAGKLPGYPASHGCIRLPAGFARDLYQITGKGTTTVVVTNHKLETEAQARVLAVNMPVPQPGERGHLIQRPEPTLAQLQLPPTPERSTVLAQAPAPTTQAAEPVAAPVVADQPAAATPVLASAPAKRAIGGQTIQLAAKGSLDEAEAYWSRISARFPELEKFEKQIIPATVGSRQYYRLRVSGPGANAACSSLKQSGTDCFPVK